MHGLMAFLFDDCFRVMAALLYIMLYTKIRVRANFQQSLGGIQWSFIYNFYTKWICAWLDGFPV